MGFQFQALSPELLIVNLLFTLERIKPACDFDWEIGAAGEVSRVFSVTSQEVAMEMNMVL